MSGLLRGLGRNVVGLGFASFFTDLGAEMITPLIPVFLVQLGAPRAALGVIEGVSDAIASLLRIVSGWMSDRLGKRKIFVFVGYGVAAAMRPLMGLATAAWHLGAVRIVDRIGKGIRLAARDALIADSCDPARRGRAFGFQRAMDNLGGVLGMLIAAALLAAWKGDLRRVFFWTAVPASCVLLVIGLVVRDHPPSAPPAKLRLTLRPFGPEFRLFLAAVAVFTLGNSSDLFIISRLSSLGLVDAWVPLVWCGHTVIRMAAALPAGILADRVGKKRMVLAGWAVYAATYAGLGFADTLAWGLALTALYGLYWSLAESVLRAIVADLVPPELRGTAYGMYYFVVGVLILPANLAFGAVWDEWGPAPAFAGSAALALLAGALLMRVPGVRPA